MRIGIIGATLWGNRGAEAMLVTTIGRLRKAFPEATYIVFSYLPSRDTDLCKDPSVVILDGSPIATLVKHLPFAFVDRVLRVFNLRFPSVLMPRSIRELRTCNILLDISGISYIDDRQIVLAFNVLTNWPALLLNIPVVKLSQSLGPMRRVFTRIAAKVALAPCQMVFARGELSVQHLSEIGLTENCADCPDTAFLYDPTYSLTQENEDHLLSIEEGIRSWKAKGDNVVGFSVSAVVRRRCEKQGLDYCGVLSKTIFDLIAEGNRVVLIPNATTGHENRHRRLNDLPIISDIQRRVKDLTPDAAHSLLCIKRDINTDGIRRLVRHCDVLIASRFHAMVAALCLGVPLLVIGWSHKYKDTLRLFALENVSHDFSELGIHNLTDLVHETIADVRNIREKTLAHLENVRFESEKQFKWIEHHLKGKM